MVYTELVNMMGESYSPEIKPKRILLLGLYGSGKTTTAAKLAKFYQDRGLSVGLIACDVTRPAAYEQLETLSKQANVSFFGIKGEADIGKIIKDGLKALKDRKVIICDSGGRSAFDEELVDQLKIINGEFQPSEKLLVINADIGKIIKDGLKALKDRKVIICDSYSSSAFNFSPVPTNIAFTLDEFTALRAPPPLPEPSSFVIITPVIFTALSNSFACLPAIWPVSAFITRSFSEGWNSPFIILS